MMMMMKRRKKNNKNSNNMNKGFPYKTDTYRENLLRFSVLNTCKHIASQYTQATVDMQTHIYTYIHEQMNTHTSAHRYTDTHAAYFAHTKSLALMETTENLALCYVWLCVVDAAVCCCLFYYTLRPMF